MSTGIQDTLKSVIGDGARSTKFDCVFQFPSSTYTPSSSDVAVMVKTSSFPYIEHTPINLMYKGRSIPIRGQAKYSQTWECSFYVTENHNLKKAFEDWIAALDEANYYNSSPTGSETTMRNAISSGYVKDLVIYQLDFENASQVVKYTLYNCFPTSTSQIPVSMEGPGSIEELTVNFSYSHFSTYNTSSASGSFSDELIGKATSLITSSVTDQFESYSSEIEKLVNNLNTNYDAGDLISDLAGSIISYVSSAVSSTVSSAISSLKSSILG